MFLKNLENDVVFFRCEFCCTIPSLFNEILSLLQIIDVSLSHLFGISPFQAFSNECPIPSKLFVGFHDLLVFFRRPSAFDWALKLLYPLLDIFRVKFFTELRLFFNFHIVISKFEKCLQEFTVFLLCPRKTIFRVICKLLRSNSEVMIRKQARNVEINCLMMRSVRNWFSYTRLN